MDLTKKGPVTQASDEGSIQNGSNNTDTIHTPFDYEAVIGRWNSQVEKSIKIFKAPLPTHAYAYHPYCELLAETILSVGAALNDDEERAFEDANYFLGQIHWLDGYLMFEGYDCEDLAEYMITRAEIINRDVAAATPYAIGNCNLYCLQAELLSDMPPPDYPELWRGIRACYIPDAKELTSNLAWEQ